MTSHYRTAEVNSIPMPHLVCKNHCDVCGKPRSSGNNRMKHTKCSEIRKARYAAEGKKS